MYDFLNVPQPDYSWIEHPIEEAGLTYIKVPEKPVYRYYGKYVKYQRFSSSVNWLYQVILMTAQAKVQKRRVRKTRT